MEFEMNNHEWEILELPKEQIKLIYEKEMNEETLYVYGLTKYDNHKIYINKELCFDMKRKNINARINALLYWRICFIRIRRL